MRLRFVLALGASTACGTSAIPEEPASSGHRGGSPPTEAAAHGESDRQPGPGPYGLPARDAAGTREVQAWWGEGARSTELRAVELGDSGWTEPRVLVADGMPDRPALSPDGETVAFVSAATGLSAVWVVPFGGGQPTQVTNVGLRTGAGRPDGFVPSPDGDSLRFDGELLRWTSPEGEHQARWR